MTHYDRYYHRPYMVRKNLGDDMYIEIMDMRVKNGRVECLSRFNSIKLDGPFTGTFSYRWRKFAVKVYSFLHSIVQLKTNIAGL